MGSLLYIARGPKEDKNHSIYGIYLGFIGLYNSWKLQGNPLLRNHLIVVMINQSTPLKSLEEKLTLTKKVEPV